MNIVTQTPCRHVAMTAMTAMTANSSKHSAEVTPSQVPATLSRLDPPS